MFENSHDPSPVSEADVLETISEIQRNTSDDVKKLRTHARISAKSTVYAQHGNSSERLTVKLQGVSGDISSGGCMVLFPVPLLVGDVYWLSFDQDVVPIDCLMARCLRCRMIREDAFEAGFRFFESVELKAVAEQTEDSLFD